MSQRSWEPLIPKPWIETKQRVPKEGRLVLCWWATVQAPTPPFWTASYKNGQWGRLQVLVATPTAWLDQELPEKATGTR